MKNTTSFLVRLAPGAFGSGRRASDRAGDALVTGAWLAACIVAAPVLALVVIAVGGDAATLSHVAANVLPTALVETGLLLAGVAVVTALLGVGAAWLVTAYRFPLRDVLAAALVLPLAVPTYIVAYIYVELLEPLGPVQTAFRLLTGYRSKAEYWFPEVRSMPGAILILGCVLYPYVYLTARALFAVQSANLLEAARTLGASPWETFRTVALPLARPALALGLSLTLLETLNDIGASEYLGVRTLTVVDLHDVVEPRQPARRRADRLRDAAFRRSDPVARGAGARRAQLHRLDEAPSPAGADPGGRGARLDADAAVRVAGHRGLSRSRRLPAS